MGIDPSPKELASMHRGRSVSFRMPGFGASDFDADASSFVLALDTESTYASRRLVHRIEGR